MKVSKSWKVELCSKSRGGGMRSRPFKAKRGTEEGGAKAGLLRAWATALPPPRKREKEFSTPKAS